MQKLLNLTLKAVHDWLGGGMVVRQVHSIALPGNRSVASICYSPDGLKLAAAAGDGCVYVLDTASRTASVTLPVCPGSSSPPLVSFGAASNIVFTLREGLLQVLSPPHPHTHTLPVAWQWVGA